MLGIVGMVAIANLQYGWTLFVNPIDSKFHWGKATIQVAFTLFVLAETWLVPVEGSLSGDVWRPVRPKICDGELRSALHRQRDSLAARAGGQSCEDRDR